MTLIQTDDIGKEYAAQKSSDAAALALDSTWPQRVRARRGRNVAGPYLVNCPCLIASRNCR
ncbi:hypothetical protein [Phytomonospora endophytica]|uniref:Uncharacterized protein n=1 Tax=Phytomonospora endophytica TaxID=714109 RepID=A0A841G390_9ACTN|nr:hypothetical protein [Phytomonospora endophytica]MBB6038580.1 hypothetical protein [Phytomonospora endophytica]GIG69277.1 hypothetical protein Pen01_55720 [Phytomonospora endophytica]